MNERTEKAIFAGGCFWDVQDLIRKRPGVLSTRVGCTRSDVANTPYRTHGTHVEAIEVTFDPNKTSYRELLEFFFQVQEPTSRNRKGHDVAASDRARIFYLGEQQRQVAEGTLADGRPSGLLPGLVVTVVSPAGPFWEAEPEHQDDLGPYPNGYADHLPPPGWAFPHRDDVA
jgi:peptide-methionine (S)-S-oxide reductase